MCVSPALEHSCFTHERSCLVLCGGRVETHIGRPQRADVEPCCTGDEHEACRGRCERQQHHPGSMQGKGHGRPQELGKEENFLREKEKAPNYCRA